MFLKKFLKYLKLNVSRLIEFAEIKTLIKHESLIHFLLPARNTGNICSTTKDMELNRNRF